MDSVKDYLSSPETIKKVIEELMGKTIEELACYKKSDNYINDLVKSYETDSNTIIHDYKMEGVSKLSLIEMLVLLQKVRNDFRYKFTYKYGKGLITSNECYVSYVRLLLNFVLGTGSEKDNRLLYMFGSFPIRKLYFYNCPTDTGIDFTRSENAFIRLQAVYENHMRKYGFMYVNPRIVNFDENTTVYEFLCSCYMMSRVVWLPASDDPKIYVESIKSALDVAGIFLVDFFVMKYREKCDIDIILEKCRTSTSEIDESPIDEDEMMEIP